jgi:Phosphatidylglycerophosphate synthase
MNYSLKDVYNSLSPEKRKADGTMTTILYRPVSYPASWLFLRAGLTPNAVTYASAAGCIAALLLALLPFSACHFAAIALFLVFAVLDCADGNMARTLGRKTVYGGWVDAAGGYLAYATELFSIGLSCFFFSGDFIILPFSGGAHVELPWGSATWILLGGLASVSNTLMRLFHQAFKNAENAAGIPSVPGAEKRFSEEIGITGYLPVLYLAGLLTGLLPFVLVAYTVIYSGGFLMTTAKQLRKVSVVP